MGLAIACIATVGLALRVAATLLAHPPQGRGWRGVLAAALGGGGRSPRS